MSNYNSKDTQSNNLIETQSDQMILGFGPGIWSWILLKKWYFCHTVKQIIICYIFLAIFFGVLSALTSIIYIPLQQYHLRYADINGCLDGQYKSQKDHSQISSRCQLTFQITKQMKAPIHFLYRLQNIYINHRHYLNSYDKSQLQGNIIDQQTAQTNCQPFVYNKDFGKNVSWTGKPLDPNALAYPCGFKAFLFFNDTFRLKKVEGKKITDVNIIQSNIEQIQGKILNFKSRNGDQQWINPSDSHFNIWMQSQSLMTKHKLWGVLYNPLEVGNYSLIAENNYKIDRMRITKSVHITESSKIGGKSFFIPTFLGVFCIGCIVFSILFYRKFKETEKSIDKSKLR